MKKQLLKGVDMLQEVKVKTKEDIFEQTIMKNIKRKSMYIDKVQTWEGLPLFSWIDINITELCNRRCDFCPRKDSTVYPNQNLNMDLRLAKQLAEELKKYDFKGGVIFSGNSEPMLHDKITDILGVFGKSIHTELVTNGDDLTVDSVRRLFSAGLCILLISMYDGPHQVEYFRGMFNNAGIGEDQYCLRDRWYTVEDDYGLKLTNRAGTVKNGNQTVIDDKRPCFYMHYSMQIDWNGDILLCVQDFNKKIKFGTAYAQSLWDIWISANMTKYRKILGKGYRGLYPCNNCNVNGTLHGYNHARIWNDIYSK